MFCSKNQYPKLCLPQCKGVIICFKSVFNQVGNQAKEEFEKVKDNKTLTLLLTQNHRTYSDNDGVVCYYENGLYYERNDFWYLREHPTKTVNSKNDLVKLLNLTDKYIGFAPGGCCIVPRENILKHSKEIYQKLKDCTSWHQFPGEAYLIERGLYNLWL